MVQTISYVHSKNSDYDLSVDKCKEGSRMEGTLDFDSLDIGANF